METEKVKLMQFHNKKVKPADTILVLQNLAGIRIDKDLGFPAIAECNSPYRFSDGMFSWNPCFQKDRGYYGRRIHYVLAGELDCIISFEW